MVLRQDGDPGQLVGPLVGGEPGQLEDQPVGGREAGDGAVPVPVPGLHPGAGDRDVEVERERRGGEQADRADQAFVGRRVDEQPAASQRRVRLVEGGQRDGVRVGLLGRGGAAEPAVEPGVGVVRLLERERRPAGALREQAQLREGQRDPPGQ